MKRSVFLLLSFFLLATSCKTFNYAERQTVSITLVGDDFEFGNIVSYEDTIGKKDEIESVKSQIIGKLLKEYPEYDTLLFPKYEINSSGRKMTVSGRLAKIKDKEN
jgi:hypothetical protein